VIATGACFVNAALAVSAYIVSSEIEYSIFQCRVKEKITHFRNLMDVDYCVIHDLVSNNKRELLGLKIICSFFS